MRDKFNHGKVSYGGQHGKGSSFKDLSGLKNLLGDMNKQYVENYYNELKKGYFTPNGVLKKYFIILYPDIIADNLSSGRMTYTQIRNFYDYVLIAANTYRYAKDAGDDSDETKEKLLLKIKRLDGMITYALARDNPSVTEEFRRFILANVEVCNTIEDVVNGFLPHFEAIVGYFKYRNPKSK